jgi:hypothetical protein
MRSFFSMRRRVERLDLRLVLIDLGVLWRNASLMIWVLQEIFLCREINKQKEPPILGKD